MNKCAVTVIKSGQSVQYTEGIKISAEDETRAPDPGGFYKYLGVSECQIVYHEETEEKNIYTV